MKNPPDDLSALASRIAAAQQKTALVVGDVMLDRFVYGAVNRISPESAAPVLDIRRDVAMPGGAANVAANLRATGMKVRLLAVIGDDGEGRALAALLRENDIDTAGLIVDPARPTTLKTRFVTAGAQLLRADRETRDDVDGAVLLERAASLIKQADILILSDYNKGLLTVATIRALTALAQAAGLPVLVDPKKNDFAVYAGAGILTPNRRELGALTGMAVTTQGEIEVAARALMEKGNFPQLLVTRSEDGMSVFAAGAAPLHLPAESPQAVDVSGAGDTVIAWLAAGLAAGAGLADAARLANRAASLAVGRAGTASIDARELQGALKDLPAPAIPATAGRQAPLLGWDEAAAQVRNWRQQGLQVGFTNGCFDILHFGHVNYLERARERCDRLVVALNHDASVRLLKGPERPLHDEASRAAVLGALASVDLVVLFGAQTQGQDNTPCALIETIKPDIYFKGGDYKIEQLPEAAIMKALSGSVEIMPLYNGHSTTTTIKKMQKTEVA